MSMPSPVMVGVLVVTKPASSGLSAATRSQIGAEAAAGQNDGLGADRVFAVLILDLHADSLAVFHDQLGGGGVGAQVDLILGLHIGGQHFDQIRADRGGLAVLGGGAVDALDARAAERADVGADARPWWPASRWLRQSCRSEP